MKKKLFVDIYLAKNIGDDLFLDILAKKFPNANFTVNYVGNEYDNFLKSYQNVQRRTYTLVDKILQRLKLKNTLTNYKDISENYDALIFIGGSIFREESYHNELYADRLRLVEQFKKKNKPIYVIGSNFGPYYSDDFYEDYRNFYKMCTDVCFRDQYSYNLFSDLENVRLAPDVVFQLDINEFQSKDKNQIIGFSIIDVNHKPGLSKYEEQYINSTIQTMKKIIDEGYICQLMSFCTKEGDMRMIEKIMNRIDCDYKDKIKIYEYRGNIEEALSIIATFRMFVAARFHANILSQLFGIGVLPVIYSSKTSNLLDDLNLNKIKITMDDLHLQYDDDILMESFFNYTDVEQLKLASKNQFMCLSRFIEGD